PTLAAIPERLEVARKVAPERVLVELTKLLTGVHPGAGLQPLRASGLLGLWLPELQPMAGCGQNRHHRYDVWEHTLEVVRLAPAEPEFRWAALLHDAGKPGTRTEASVGEAHFYGHEARSLELAGAILGRLKAANRLQKDVLALIRHHGTHPEPAWSDAACRRFLRRLVEDGLPLDRWAAFRLADQRAKGLEDPDRDLRHQAVVDRLVAMASAQPPLSVRDLALDGEALMALAGRRGGPWLGRLQAALLDAVLEAPSLNTPEALAALARASLDGSAPPPGPPAPPPVR
ncbi:MAG TPA: HD domain-containing protein, partial [Holophagaceae bacterium]